MTSKLIEYRPGCFARLGDVVEGSDGDTWRYAGLRRPDDPTGGWHAPGAEDDYPRVPPPELLSFPVDTHERDRPPAFGWGGARS